jgi:flagellar motor component MotA
LAVIIGIILGLGATFGGFVAMGGHLSVVWQPFEYVIIGGIAFSTFIIANPLSVIKDTGSGIMQAMKGTAPKRKDFLALLSLLYALMRDMRQKPRNEIEAHIDSLVATWRNEVERCHVSRRALRYQVPASDNAADRLLYNHNDRIKGLWPTLQSLRNVENSALLKVL